MAPRSLFHPLSSVRFEDKTRFSADQHLSFARSKWFTLPETESGGDMWSIAPPDFSVKLYRSLSLPREKERKTHSNPAGPQPGGTKWTTGTFLTKVLHESYHKEGPAKFVTCYRPPDALECELMFVKAGKHPSGPYRNPKPHDFRPLDEDLPHMVTTHERDPGKLSSKLKHLDTIRTTGCESDFRPRDTRTRMDTYKRTEPRWDARLTLPRLLWPPESASYTRHRRRRGAYSAFLDRVEEKLSRCWKDHDSATNVIKHKTLGRK
ncbi:putative uncharacterized protein C7orf78 homolog [Pempheris klunzingeri]|uniref:putative uncharacterized protein C7orf78 homolog n=1 Tax=Pempheris klunzingeri TaxID=3127111 RepID=UPI00397F9909